MSRVLLVLSALMPRLAAAQDACPEDPDKISPGLCGCGSADTDWDGDGVDDSCVHPTAVVHASAFVGFGARLGTGATVGTDSVLGRWSAVGAGSTVGSDVALSRLASVGTDSVVEDGVLVGYRSTVGAQSHLAGNVVVGPAAQVGARTTVGENAVVGRRSVVGDDVSIGHNSVLGPMVHVADRAVVGAATRVRRGASIGLDTHVEAGVRIGRDVYVGRGAHIGEGAVLRGDVLVEDWATVPAEQYLPRGSVVEGVNAPPVIDAVDIPATVDLLSTVGLSVTASDPQVGQPLSTLWSIDESATGWTLTDPTTPTPQLSVADGDSAPSVLVRVTVSDGTFEASAEQRVAHRNDPPVFDSVTVPSTLAMNSAVQLTAEASDPQGQDVTVTWSILGTSTGWTLSPEGRLSVGGFGSAGSVTVQVSATDGYATANQPLTVTLEWDTPRTCTDLQGTGAPSGVYTIQPPGSGAFSVYCDLDTAGGGWTLISNRRAGASNRETCGSRLRDFFASGCGSATAIAAHQSYALNQSQRTSLPRTQMLVIQYLNGVPDYDDAYIVNLGGQSADLFPATSSLQHFPVTSVCTLGGSCDSSQVYWKYIGDYWFHNGSCASSSSGDSNYRGNYGICHNGASTSGNVEGAWASSFTGNRDQYDETKLWGYTSYVGQNYQERIFFR